MASVRKRKCKGKKGEIVEVWVVDYLDADGKRRLHTPRPNSKAAAEKVKKTIAKNPHLTRCLSKYTIKDICRNHLMIMEQRFADGDRMSKQRLMREWTLVYKIIVPALGEVIADDFSPMQLQNWVDELRSKKVGKSLGVIREALGTLSAAFSEAQRLEIVTRNVVKAVPPRLPPVQHKPIEVPTRDEIKALLEASSGRIALIVEIAVFTGMRIGEIRALMWPQIDFDRRVIRVKHSAEPDGKLKSPKTRAGIREVPMCSRVAISLRNWKIAHPRNQHELLFPCPAKARRQARQAISYAAIANDWTDLKVKADVDRALHFHALRHAAASLYIETGLSAQRLKVLMGHTSIAMTYDRYGYLFPDDNAAQLASAQIEANLMGGL